jgi:hypothetical protein
VGARAGVYAGAWLAVVVAWSTSPLAGLAVTAAGAAAYWWSLKRHPFLPCPRCGGRKAHIDTTFLPGTGGRCLVCRGEGLLPRLGVRIFRRADYQAIRSGKKGKYY